MRRFVYYFFFYHILVFNDIFAIVAAVSRQSAQGCLFVYLCIFVCMYELAYHLLVFDGILAYVFIDKE